MGIVTWASSTTAQPTRFVEAPSGEQPTWRTLNIEAEKLDSDFFRVQWHVVDQLHKSINLVSARICRGDDALRTLDTLVKIKGLL